MTQVDPTWIRPAPGWVCDECAFDFDGTDPTEAAATIRGFGRRYRAPLTRGLPDEDLDAMLRARPETGGWSALEYACHVRDAFAIYDHRIGRILEEDRPDFPAMHRDDVAVQRDYNGQDPAAVADDIGAAAETLASRFETLDGPAWERVGVRDGFEMTLAWIARNAVHEGNHHLLDVGRVLRTVRGR